MTAPSLLFLTEHDPNSSVLRNTNIPGYSLLAEYSRGVAIFKHDLTEIKTTTIDVSNFCRQFICKALKMEQPFFLPVGNI